MTAAIDAPAPLSTGTPSPATSRARYVVGIVVTGTLLVVVLPSVSGVAWGDLWRTLDSVPMTVVAGLVALWALGLALHTITLTAALPGLTARRAATLSLTGSAVANVLPVGGAAGIALNVKMGRTWGFGGQAMSRYTVVTNVWDVLVKVSLPLLVLPVLLLSGARTHQLALATPVAAASLLVLTVGCLALLTPRGATVLGHSLDRTGAAVRRRREGAVDRTWERRLTELQSSTAGLVRLRWRRLTLGMVLYTLALLALLECCLLATGAVVAPLLVLSVFTLERLLTLAGVTPGGAGLVEVALAALLASSGAPGAAVAGIVLYRLLTVALEVPVGGIWLLAWLSCRARASWRPEGVTACASST